MSENIQNEENKNEQIPGVVNSHIEETIDPFERFEQKRDEELKGDSETKVDSPKEEPVKRKGRPPKEDKPEVSENKDLDNKDDSPSLKEIEELKSRYEKEKKSAYEAQRWGTKNSQRVKGAEKRLKALLEEEILSSDEEDKIKEVLDLLASDPKEDIEIETNASAHPMQKFFKIANELLPNFRQYTDDENLDNKIGSFNAFCREATPEEQEEIIDELDSLDNDVARLKRMLAIGQKNYEEGFKEIISSGGVKKALQAKNKEIEKHIKEIEKLKKKLTEYEDFDSNGKYRLDETSGSFNSRESDKEEGDPFEQMEARKIKALRQGR